MTRARRAIASALASWSLCVGAIAGAQDPTPIPEVPPPVPAPQPEPVPVPVSEPPQGDTPPVPDTGEDEREDGAQGDTPPRDDTPAPEDTPQRDDEPAREDAPVRGDDAAGSDDPAGGEAPPRGGQQPPDATGGIPPGSNAPVKDAAAAPGSTASAASRSALDYALAPSESAYAAELAALVAQHPARARTSSLGTSRGGRELVLLTLTDLGSGDPDKKPAVLLVTGLDPSFDAQPAGPQAALFAARDLLERAAADPAFAAWLARTSVYVLPAPDPDAVFAPGGAQPRACRLDRNFPADWQPWSSQTCAQGPYPLSEPETRSIARFLTQRANIGAIVLLSRGADVLDAGAAGESELERILYARIAGALAASGTRTDAGAGTAAEAAAGTEDRAAADALARRSQAFARESGSLGAFCRAHLAAFVVSIDPFGTAVGETPLGRAPAAFTTIAGTVARLARELPRLACTVQKTERLRERLWKIDVAVENQGLLPTLPEVERARCASSVWLEATGGRIAQLGVSRGDTADANAVLRPPGSWMVGHLDGREKLVLHVLVEAAEGTSVELVLKTLREGETSCALTLH